MEGYWRRDMYLSIVVRPYLFTTISTFDEIVFGSASFSNFARDLLVH
jgi:hypothetical protein